MTNEPSRCLSVFEFFLLVNMLKILICNQVTRFVETFGQYFHFIKEKTKVILC